MPVWLETSPGNLRLIPLILQLFSNAKFIICQRHPFDTGLSIYQQGLSSDHAYAHNLNCLGRYINRQYSLTEQLKNQLKTKIYICEYEKLINNTKEQVTELIEFCGLEYSSLCLTPEKSNRIIKTPSAQQVNQPINTNGLHKHKRYAEYLTDLMESVEGKYIE